MADASPTVSKPSLVRMADAIRVLAMDGVEKAKSGHPGMPMGMADVATVLFSRFLKFEAGRLKLSKLTVLWDDNEITIDGKVSLSDTTNQAARFKAAGWAVKVIDGHDHKAIAAALRWATRQDKPTLIACKTRIGKGAATMEGSHKTHGAALGAAEIAATRQALGWTHEPFDLPADIAKAWKSVGRRGAKHRKAWEARLAASGQAADFTRAMKGDLPANAFDKLEAVMAELVTTQPAQATRQSSGAALDQLFAAIPEIIGGSADLTGSNNTYVKDTPIFDAPDYAGRYVNYGIREFGMAAAMNGLALHGGVIPYGGTFMVFSDYSRPAIRLGALMGVRAIHVLTHDSIGLGEDGPTHQPVEHLAALRAIPNLNVFRPADTIEAMECWQIALQSKTTPSAMALSRQKTPAVRTTASRENLSSRGAYEIKAASSEARVTLFGTGTELALALKAAETLEAEGVPTRVVSVPCFELFEQQDAQYQASVLGRGTVRVAVEAAIRQGWDRFIGEDGGFVGMTGFGASAPAEVLYEKFGVTAEAVVAAAKTRL